MYVGLRKVTDNMKTHKNPELRASSVVKADSIKPTAKAPPKYGSSTATKKPPVLALQGKKWVVVSVLLYYLLTVFTGRNDHLCCVGNVYVTSTALF